MKVVKILEEMLGIYKKYYSVVETIGTISMSPADKERLAELEQQYKEYKDIVKE